MNTEHYSIDIISCSFFQKHRENERMNTEHNSLLKRLVYLRRSNRAHYLANLSPIYPLLGIFTYW